MSEERIRVWLARRNEESPWWICSPAVAASGYEKHGWQILELMPVSEHEGGLTPLRKLLAEALDYARHDSWRCEYPPHFYLANPERSKELMEQGNCPCNLLDFEARARAALKEGDNAA